MVILKVLIGFSREILSSCREYLDHAEVAGRVGGVLRILLRGLKLAHSLN